jgi:serine protease
MQFKTLLTVSLGVSAALAAAVPALSAPPAHRYLVEFAPGRAANGKAAVQAVGGAVKLDLARFNAVAAVIPDAKVSVLRSNPAVKLVELDQVRYPISAVHALPSGADRGFSADGTAVGEVVPYGIPMVQADQVRGDTSAGAKVCVIDSGYDIRHEDKPKQPIVSGTDDSGTGPWTEDGSGHGTHVSGTINALDNELGVIGVFPSAAMHVVRVFGNDGNWAYSSDLIDAVSDCMTNGADVINMSLGGELPSRLENAVFLQATNRGVLSIAAAGNGGDGRTCDMWADRPERHACKMHYPSAYDSVMSVAAVDDKMALASFSQRNTKVEIAAPGVSVLSTVPVGSVMDVTLAYGSTSTDVVPMDNFEIPTTPVSGMLQDCGFGATAAACGNATGKVCLIERGGDVTFAQKAVSCQTAGGVAAVVFQNPTTAGPVLGTLGDVHVNIPVVGTDRATGLELKANYLGSAVTLTFAVSDYNYDYLSGTSMATPHVAGVATLLKSRHPQCGPTDLRAAMTATAKDLGPVGLDRYFGHGLVQAKAADDYLTKTGCTGQ